MTNKLQYTGLELDRGDALRRDPLALEHLWNSEHCRVLPMHQDRHLFALDTPGAGQVSMGWLTPAELEPVLHRANLRTYLGTQAGKAYFALEIDAHDRDALCYQYGQLFGQGTVAKFIDLRSVSSTLDYATAGLLAYARAITHWRRQNRFCSLCGSSLHMLNGGHVLECSDADCKRQTYPRTDPAVIMLVERTNAEGVRECLLGRHPNWYPGMYSTLAGFVEPGESLEDAVRREVAEESGVTVGEVRYIASQPWPFPASIMLGFIAEALTTEITLDPHELEDARWFSQAELATFGEWGSNDAGFALPRRDSISRFLVMHWLAGQGNAISS